MKATMVTPYEDFHVYHTHCRDWQKPERAISHYHRNVKNFTSIIFFHMKTYNNDQYRNDDKKNDKNVPPNTAPEQKNKPDGTEKR